MSLCSPVSVLSQVKQTEMKEGHILMKYGYVSSEEMKRFYFGSQVYRRIILNSKQFQINIYFVSQ